MRKLLLLSLCLGLLSTRVMAIGSPYTSVVNGNWNVGATWGNGGNVAGTDYPIAGQAATIALNTTVTVPSGTFAVGNLTMNNSTTAILNINGTLEVNGIINFLAVNRPSINVNSGGTIRLKDGSSVALNLVTPAGSLPKFIINSGGTYEMNYSTGGTVPNITFNAGSIVRFTGYTSATATTPAFETGVAMQNVEWNCPSQGNDIFLNGAMPIIAGYFSVLSTGPLPWYLVMTSSASSTLSVGSDFTVSGGAYVILTDGGGSFGLTVNGNTTVTGAGSELDLKNSTGIGTLYPKGNLTLSSGAIISNFGLGASNIIFDGSSITTFTNSGTISNAVNFVIANGRTLNFGTSAMTGSGSFTLQAGGTMGVGSVDGLNIAGTALGNVKVTGTRTYTAGGNIVYNGSGQNLGNEWGSTGALFGVAVNLEIANTSNGVVTNNVIGSTSVVGNLTLTSGSLSIGTSNTLDIKSNFIATAGLISGNATSNLTFSGSGTVTGSLSFAGGAQNLNNFTINRAADITLASALTLSGTLAFASSGNLQFNGLTLTVNGDITQAGSGALSSTNTATNLVIGGTGALSALPFCTSCGIMNFNNVTFGRTSGGAYTWASAARVNGTLSLNSGTLTHSSGLTMVTGSTFSRSSGSSVATNAPGTTGSYNVTYIGNLTTSLELPSSTTALNNLTSAGNVTLDKSITINGDVNINSGTLDASTFNVTMAGANFLVNGGTFIINTANTVTFSRAGTTALTGTSVAGTQFGNITINSGATLSAPNANINVSGTWSNSGVFTANTGSVTFNGASQNLNPNAQAFNDVVFAGTGTKTLLGTLTANGTLTIAVGSTLNVGANQSINVAGSWANSGTFTAGGGTVTFNGIAQNINASGQAFFNLTLAGSGTKTLTNTITISGALTINSGVTFDVGASAYAISIAGNWINNGIFTRQTGTVTFNGTTTISGTGAASFNNVTISPVSGGLTAPAGSMDVSGNWLQSSGTFTANGGTLQFSGNAQSITPGGQTFNNVTISGTNTKTLLGTTALTGTLTLTAGTFDTNANAVDLKGNFVSNSTSVLTASAITFSGTTALSGATTPTFGAVTVTNTGTLTPSTSFNVNGNLLNNGILTANAGTVTFGGNTTISGSNACSFNDILISSTLAASSGTLNVAGTWTNNGTFTANGGTTVFNGTTSIAGSSSTNFANIVISGTLNGPATIGVGGNFTNNGTFNRGTGTVVFNGSSTQSISGVSLTDFNNITVSNNINTPAVQVQSNQNLRGVLTLSGTNTVFDADGSGNTSIFKLISTGDSPTVDAGIATLPVGTSVSGSVTVQRFMAIEGGNSTRIYRYISSPVSGAAVSQIQSFIPVTGTFTGASSCSGCATSQSMFSYDETVITGDLNTGYINFPAATNTETFVLGLGYSIYERGNVAPVSTAGNGRWELRGPINSGSVSLPVSFTSSGTAANDGWNLVGNPYPATIDWDAVSWTKTNINLALYMRDNGQISPVYATYIGTIGANGGSRYIATGQGFFVKANAVSPVLQATEAVKVASQQTTFFREATEQKLIRIAMRQGIKSDEAVIRFTNESTNGFDSQWDAIKLANPTSTSSPMFSFSSFGSDNAKYVINSLQQLSCGTAVKMDVSNATSGSYSLNFTQLESFPPTVTLLLKDAYTNASVDLKSTPSYSFTVDTSIPGTFGDGRFTIQFNVESDLPTSINAISKDFCSGQEGKLTITGSKLGTSYSLFQEGKQIQDPMIGTGNDIQFALSKTIKAGISTIEVKASSLTCNTLSISQNILVNNVSLPVISSVTNSKNCNAGAVTLIAAGAPANGSYRWYGSKDSLEPIEGQTSEKFITPVLNKTKTYYVSTMNSLGCEGERKEVLAEIINYDNALITLVDSVTLSSNYDTGNQWYFEDKLIEGATGKTLKPEKTGVYKLKISTSGECSTSAERTFKVTEVKQKETPATITGLEESLPSHMTVYPNPTSSLLSIAVKSSNEVNAKLLTVLGTNLFNQPLEGTDIKKGSFDMQDQADGIYILIVQDGDKIYKTRVIKKR